MADYNTVAKQFTEFYYQTFDTNRAGLANLYRDASMLTFEGDAILGATAIGNKLSSLAFESVQHRILSLDGQPASPNGDIIVLVTGQLLVNGESNPLNFSQAFHLVPDAGSFYVYNDVFRLVYG